MSDFREQWGKRVQRAVDTRNAANDFVAGRIDRDALIDRIVSDPDERSALAMKWLREALTDKEMRSDDDSGGP